MANHTSIRKFRKATNKYFKGTKKRKMKDRNGEIPNQPLHRNKNYKENNNLTKILMEEFEKDFYEEPEWDALIHQRW